MQTVKKYAVFVERVRESIGKWGKEKGINQAVDSCIKDGVLREILMKNKTEVIGMSLTEYDEQEQMELFREEGEKRGEAKRLVSGVEAVMRNLGVDLETACKVSDVTVEQYLKAKEQMELYE